jgi:hypothetical protein
LRNSRNIEIASICWIWAQIASGIDQIAATDLSNSMERLFYTQRH